MEMEHRVGSASYCYLFSDFIASLNIIFFVSLGSFYWFMLNINAMLFNDILLVPCQIAYLQLMHNLKVTDKVVKFFFFNIPFII